MKLTKEETVDLVMDLYLKGYNCGEASITALMRCLGYDLEIFPRAGTALGGGFGGEHRYQCGALSAGVFAAGAAFGRDDPSQSRQNAYQLSTRLYEEFGKEFNGINCFEIVGLPAVSGEAWDVPYKQLNKRQEKCQNFVRFAIERWYELAEEIEKDKDSSIP